MRGGGVGAAAGVRRNRRDPGTAVLGRIPILAMLVICFFIAIIVLMTLAISNLIFDKF
jgi:hypothetical protein